MLPGLSSHGTPHARSSPRCLRTPAPHHPQRGPRPSRQLLGGQAAGARWEARPPDCQAPGGTQEGGLRGEGPHLSRDRQVGWSCAVDPRGAGCLLPTPVLALQPDAGCAPRTLGVHIRGHPSTLASSRRPGQAFPFQTLHWAGTEGSSADRSGGEPRAGFRGWDHGTGSAALAVPSSGPCVHRPFSPRDPRGGRRESSQAKLGLQLNACPGSRGRVLPPEPTWTWEPAGARDGLVCGKLALPALCRALTHLSDRCVPGAAWLVGQR